MGVGIVVIDDNLQLLTLCKDVLAGKGYRCSIVYNSLEAMDTIRREKPKLVITDLKMPRKDGFEILAEVKAELPELPVMILTGHGSIESVVKAMNLGACDYLTKPFTPEQFCLHIKRALKQQDQTDEIHNLRQELAKHEAGDEIIGSSRAMQQVFAMVERAAPTHANVLISGESGTGKEMIARAIHRQSRRDAKPFVPIDCVALPDQLIESELFGHEEGAFTGAVASKEGLFESADGGTLFLDEITEMNIELQSKLLRVLQERQCRRVGGRELYDVDIRIIAATNRDPEEAMVSGRLRTELYYRLNVIPITLPPLRERSGDVVQLVNHFLKKFREANGKQGHAIRKDALDALLNYPWPGNVRELQNLMERLVVLTISEEITREDLPDHILHPELHEAANGGAAAGLADLPFKQAKKQLIEQFEIEYLTRLLHRHEGNISKAARAAGIDRKTIYRLISGYGIHV